MLKHWWVVDSHRVLRTGKVKMTYISILQVWTRVRFLCMYDTAVWPVQSYPTLTDRWGPREERTIYRPVYYCWKMRTGSCPSRQINVVRAPISRLWGMGSLWQVKPLEQSPETNLGPDPPERSAGEGKKRNIEYNRSDNFFFFFSYLTFTLITRTKDRDSNII